MKFKYNFKVFAYEKYAIEFHKNFPTILDDIVVEARTMKEARLKASRIVRARAPRAGHWRGGKRKFENGWTKFVLMGEDSEEFCDFHE